MFLLCRYAKTYNGLNMYSAQKWYVQVIHMLMVKNNIMINVSIITKYQTLILLIKAMDYVQNIDIVAKSVVFDRFLFDYSSGDVNPRNKKAIHYVFLVFLFNKDQKFICFDVNRPQQTNQ